MSRLGTLVAAGLCSTIVLASESEPARAQAEPSTYVDPDTGHLVYVADLGFPRPQGTAVFGYLPVTDVYWIFNPLDPLQPGFACQFILPSFRHGVFCQGSDGQGRPRRLEVILGPGRNRVDLRLTTDRLPGEEEGSIVGNRGPDEILGGPGDERISTKKGKDDVNPGPGNDEANLGPGKDTANTRDGEADTLNGGKGEDAATVDKKDKVKNVEKVRRR